MDFCTGGQKVLSACIRAGEPEDLVAGLDPTWHEEAQTLLHVWEQAVRASSAVENWHSILPFGSSSWPLSSYACEVFCPA